MNELMEIEQRNDSSFTVEELLRFSISVNASSSCLEVLEYFLADKSLIALPIVNNEELPVGIILRQEVTEFFSKLYSKELYGKKHISALMDTAPIIVDRDTEIEDVARIIIDAGMQHMVSGFIITREKKFFGMATGYDLLDAITVQKQNRLFNLAHFDQLTGLPNRRLLVDRIQYLIASNLRNGIRGALLFIDLDKFKNINDTLGHDIGDLLLTRAAKRLSSCMRQGDTVARLGGDEFVVMLANLSDKVDESMDQIRTVCEKILRTLAQPYLLDTFEYHGSASIGATLFHDNSTTVDELLKQADIAMYQAKKSGPNTLRFFTQQMQTSITHRFSLEGELRKALELKQFQLYYQIQVDSSHRPIGAEVLIRWMHPERGMISPAQFIPLAEETGLILPIGQWALDTACAQIKAWKQDPLTRDLVLAVNVSARQLHQADFVAQVQDAIQRHAINPTLLKLELTEGMLLNDIEDTIRIMNVLSGIGIQFSLDDFGTGYSSLQYIKRLPLDQLKIDQSFIRNIVSDNNDKAIVQTIIVMSRSLDMDVIAEGVETEKQRDLLLDRGCTHYQGYLFGKPMPIQEFQRCLDRSFVRSGSNVAMAS